MKPSFGRNSDGAWRALVDTCKDLLLNTAVGAIMKYSTLAKAADKPVNGRDCSFLRTALNELERQGVTFECIPSVGYRRLDGEGTVTRKAGHMIGRANRINRRTLGMSRAVDESALSSAAKQTKWANEFACSAALRSTNKRRLKTEARKQSAVAEEQARLAAQLNGGASQEVVA